MKIFFVSAMLMMLLCSAGCFQSVPKPAGDATAVSTPDATTDEATPRETLNKTTQNVLDLDQAVASGAVLAETKAKGPDPLTQSAAAYRTTVGKLGAMAVQQAIQIRNAQSIKDPKPLGYDEFMREIIRKDQPDGIQLAMLPYYQEYAWDSKGQALVVVDFPARKEERQKQLQNN
jgi:hypothetical protein